MNKFIEYLTYLTYPLLGFLGIFTLLSQENKRKVAQVVYFPFLVLTIFFALLWSTQCHAFDFGGFERYDVTKWSLTDTKLMEVNEVYLDYMHYTWAVEPFMYPNTPTNRLDLHLNVDFLNRILFINNMVHSETDKYQYRLVGWNYRAGIHLGDYIDVFFEHFSFHLLDVAPVYGPQSYDAVGIRINIYKRKD